MFLCVTPAPSAGARALSPPHLRTSTSSTPRAHVHQLRGDAHGHTTTCITSAGGPYGGPAANTDQQAGWAGRPIFVTDEPKQPKVNPEPDRPRPERRHDRRPPRRSGRRRGNRLGLGPGGTRPAPTPTDGASTRCWAPSATRRPTAGAVRAAVASRRTVFPTRDELRFMHNAAALATTRPTRATATSSTRPRRSSRAAPSRTAAPTTASSSSPRWMAATTARGGAPRRRASSA